MAEENPLKVCLASAEVAPLAKTGGLADVAAALSTYLHQAGHEVRLLMPRYAAIDTAGLEVEPVDGLQELDMRIGHRTGTYSIDSVVLPGTDLPVYLVRSPELYGHDGIYASGPDEHLRFILLARAALEFCQHTQFAPDIVHAHDWHAALLPLYLKSVYAWDALFGRARSVLTIHNIGYQGMFAADVVEDLDLGDAARHLHQDDLAAGMVNFLKTGLLYADLLTTVSPTYAEEIQRADYGMGLDGVLRERRDNLIGILNGVDYGEWNPETDPHIPATYSVDDLDGKRTCKTGLLRQLDLEPEPDRPLFGVVSRLVGQKGIDLMQRVLPTFLADRDVGLAVLGSGEPRFEHFFSLLQERFPGRVCFYRGYSNELAHWIEAGSDFFLMPSIYEPCGLNQMYSLRYGTVPIVRATGGLVDSVEPIDRDAGTGTGIVFRDYDETGLRWALDQALSLYRDGALLRKVIERGMRMDFSWEHQGGIYVDYFRRLAPT